VRSTAVRLTAVNSFSSPRLHSAGTVTTPAEDAAEDLAEAAGQRRAGPPTMRGEAAWGGAPRSRRIAASSPSSRRSIVTASVHRRPCPSANRDMFGAGSSSFSRASCVDARFWMCTTEIARCGRITRLARSMRAPIFSA
jgi:hypothetical protein